jgi:glycosyltransferase involved in cell wall biosynthesis
MWRRHHGLILPSRNEGLPLAIVEAMFCARLCIVTDVADNAAFLENGVNGFIAEAPVVRCLERTIEEAWQSKDRWQAMGLNARQTILDQFPKNPVKDFCEELLDCANTL